MRRAHWLGMVCLLLCGGFAHAVDGSRAMERYLRRQWGSEQGLAGGRVNAVAQTPDGYLWVGTEQSLMRFDGLRFTPMQLNGEGPVGHVTSLTVDRDGALWILTDNARLLRYAEGRFTTILSTAQRESAVISLARAQGSGVLADGLAHGVMRLSGSSLTTIPVNTSSLLISLAQTTDGRIWMGTREAGLLVWQDGKVTSLRQGIPDLKINCLLSTDDGQLWIGTDNGLARWDGHTITTQIAPNEQNHLQILTMVQDRDGNLWAGTSRGLLRYNASGVEWLPRAGHDRNTAVSALLEDREGDLWFGNGQSLERLRDSPLMTYGDSEDQQGDQYGATYVDNHGRAWFAPLSGGLYWMRDGVTHHVEEAGLDEDVVYSIDGRAGEVWVGRQRGGLTRLREIGDSFAAQTWTATHGLAQDSVYAVRVIRDGSVWAGTLTEGACHFAGGRFTHYSAKSGLLSDTVSAMEESGDGTMWFATPNGVSTLDGETWRSYGAKDGLPSADAVSLLADGDHGMWIGTRSGLAYSDGKTIRPFSLFVEPILGMAVDRQGLLWLTSSTHVMSIARSALLHGGPDVPRHYGLQDGLQSTEGVRRARSVVADGLGRVWLTTNSGLSVTSPSASHPPVEALAQVERVIADGSPTTIADVTLIPAGSRRIAIDYAGLDLRDPEQMRFRYRLDSFDKNWSEPVSNRQAIYTNLAPGDYRFRVIAADRSGVWGSRESTLHLRVKPMLWQRREFQVACLAVLALIAFLIYQARLQHLIALADLQSEQRLTERTRIARELHDTLLQSFISALLHLHVTTEKVPAGSPLRKALQEVLEVMERVVEEARLAVLGLRTFAGSGPQLEQSFRQLMVELGEVSGAEYRVQAEGNARTLRPAVKEEVSAIGREAIINATRHAKAHLITVGLHYAADRFGLEIVDDGSGMDPATLLGGREGHWGITGMRERSNRIGGQLQITSCLGAGTRILLSVPASKAYSERD